MAEHAPDLLIGDRERAAALDDLRRHYEAGRLTLDELEGRTAEVHVARTGGDLDTALRQLPQSPALPTLRPRDRRWQSLALQYAVVNAIALLVWLFAGAHGDFWPRWVLLATLIMFVRRVSRHSRRRARLPRPPGPPTP